MRRKAFAARVWPRLRQAGAFFSRGDKVLAAVSGGPDSVCLAHWLAGEARRRGFTLALLHVDHGLRRAARADARFVQALGKALDVPVTVVKVTVRKKGEGLEHAARKARYAALAKAARRGGFDKVATGHQRDDQAETVLLHILRGTRLEGLAGIPPERPLAPGVTLVRPLLELSRQEVLAYLKVHGLKHRVDETNADPKLTRNWLRKDLLPRLERRAPGTARRLALLAAQVRALTPPVKR